MELYEITCDLIRLGVLTVEHKEGGTITTTGMVCDKILWNRLACCRNFLTGNGGLVQKCQETLLKKKRTCNSTMDPSGSDKKLI